MTVKLQTSEFYNIEIPTVFLGLDGSGAETFWRQRFGDFTVFAS